jgi:putrescine transport system ATP-binding protein
MNAGRLVQVGPPAEVYEQPNSRWVAGFIGDVNLIEGRVASSERGHTVIESFAGGRIVATQTVEAPTQGIACAALRPEKIQIELTQPSNSDGNCFAGRVLDVGYLGGTSLYKVGLDNGLEMRAAVANRSRAVEMAVHEGDRVWLSFAPEAVVVLP